MYNLILKPVLDLVLSFMILVVCSPLILLTAILLAFYNRGVIFFLQDRPGKSGRIFRLIKFKTMRDLYDVEGNPLPDKDRVTTIGNFVRKSSLDELPQLLNVIKGDMSLVGPRPLLTKYLPLYNEEQARRHEVKPGITGWAQVNGRNKIPWEEKFKLDVWYVDNISFKLDIKILFMTLQKVLKKEGINANAQHTMKSFNGNN